MFAKDISFHIYEITRFRFTSCVLLNKLRIISVWNEADILAVMLSGIDKAVFLCDLTYLCLAQST